MKTKAMLNYHFSMKQELKKNPNVLNARLQHLQAVISVICIIILPSAIPFCISLVHLLEKQLLATKGEQKIALVISYYSQPNIFAPTCFY